MSESAIIDFTDVADSSPVPKGERTWTINDVVTRKDDIGRVTSMELIGTTEHEGKSYEVKDVFRFNNAWSADRDIKRARKLAVTLGLIKEVDGPSGRRTQGDFTAAALVGKEVTSYVSFDDFFDTNVVKRYVAPKPSADEFALA